MHKWPIFFITLLFSMLLSPPLSSIEKEDFFTLDEIKRVDSGEIISRMYVKYDPLNESSDKDLYLKIKKSPFFDRDLKEFDIITDEKGFIPYLLDDTTKLKFYNLLVSFSLLKGMKYYSRREAKVTELIKDCYRVESLSGEKHNDITYNEIKPKITNMFLQKDNKFGKLIYKSELYNEGNNFILINTNLEPITKFLIPAADKEDFKIYTFFIYDAEKKGFYYYSLLLLKVKAAMILKQGLFGPTAFSNRLRAATVHLAKLLGYNWEDKLNAWKGKYDKY